MSNALKCPNPSCPYLFDPSRVPAGVALTCPRCAMRFTLAAPTPAAVTPGYTTPQSPPPIPPVDPVPTAGAIAPPIPGDAERGERQPTIQPVGPVVRSSGLQVGVLVLMSLALLVGAGVTVYLKVVGMNRQPGGTTGSRLGELNLSFEPPESPWVQDDDTRVKLGSPIVLVYKRPDVEAFMAFGGKDYGTRNPRTVELRDGLMQPLNQLFDDVRPEPLDSAQWLGQQCAVAFGFYARFKGDGPRVIGRCHAVRYKGIGYWSICWANEESFDNQLSTFDSTRGRFQLLQQRDNWQEKEVPIVPYQGHAFEYQVFDTEGIWKEPDPKERKPTDEDTKADLLLVAREKRKGFDRADEASLVVLVIDSAGGDPLKEGRDYVETRRREEMKSAGKQFVPTFKERTGEIEGDVSPGEAHAPVLRLESTVSGAKSQARLEVIAAIKLENKVVIAHAWCAWADRATFEGRLIQIASSLQPSK